MPPRSINIRNHFFDEERIAFRFGENQLAQRFRQRFDVEQVADELLAIFFRKRREIQTRLRRRRRFRAPAQSVSSPAVSLSARVMNTKTMGSVAAIAKICEPSSTDDGSAQCISSHTMTVGALRDESCKSFLYAAMYCACRAGPSRYLTRAAASSSSFNPSK